MDLGYTYDPCHWRRGELKGTRWGIFLYFGAEFTPQLPIEHLYTAFLTTYCGTNSQLSSLDSPHTLSLTSQYLDLKYPPS